jgi:hypothetical protein
VEHSRFTSDLLQFLVVVVQLRSIRVVSPFSVLPHQVHNARGFTLTHSLAV